MTKLWLVSPLGILFAWSGAWTCSTFTLPDGGTASFNQLPGAGSGTQGAGTSGVTVVYTPDGGGSGLQPGPDGGVTVGAAGAFSSNFVYMSNYLDGTVSRISVPSSGPPVEQARYNCLTPLDNHQTNQSCIWNAAVNQMVSAAGASVDSPSRTVVDRSGNVWVALRAPGYQAGITEIANVGDNIAQCTPHCIQRGTGANSLQPFDGVHNKAFTEGVPLNLTAGGQVTLSPGSTGIIAPGFGYATQYACQDSGKDHTGTLVNAPENYDDCIIMSIPLGDSAYTQGTAGAPATSAGVGITAGTCTGVVGGPDPLADASKKTAGSSFGRAAALSPHCNAATGQCDVWLGMWNGQRQVLLGYSNSGGQPYDVTQIINTGVSPYGSTVDCAGILWSGTVATGVLSAITTVALNAPQYGLSLPAYTLLSPVGGIPNSSSCGQYGISSDVSERIWISGYPNGPLACSFNAAGLLSNYAAYKAGTINAVQLAADLQASWKTYSTAAQYAGSNARGINTDKNNNVYMAYDATPAGVTAINPNVVGAVPCHTPNAGGAACPNASFVWPSMAVNSQGGSVGVDIDLNGNIWAGNQNPGSATQFNGSTGALMNVIPLGVTYSYSDFTGYALRNVTLNSGLYTQTFAGCQNSPELTQWQTLTYNITSPPGTDVEIEVTPTNSLAPAVLATETPITVCQSVWNGNCVGPIGSQTCTPCCAASPASACAAGGTIALGPLSIPGAQYLVVNVLLFPGICNQQAGASAAAKPTLWGLELSNFCSGN